MVRSLKAVNEKFSLTAAQIYSIVRDFTEASLSMQAEVFQGKQGDDFVQIQKVAEECIREIDSGIGLSLRYLFSLLSKISVKKETREAFKRYYKKEQIKIKSEK